MRDDTDLNPYSAPSAVDEPIAAPVTEPVARLNFRECAICTFAVIANLSLGFIALRHSLNDQWLIALFTATASVMCISLVDHKHSFRQRCSVSLAVPFAMAGLACFVLLYFQMFRFRWFEAVFNDKGTGPLGLLVAGLIGFSIGGLVGWRAIKYTGVAPSEKIKR